MIKGTAGHAITPATACPYKECRCRGARDAPGGMLDIPRLEPRPNAFLQFQNNLIGDLLIDIGFIPCS
jgi:hypothetical protein